MTDYARIATAQMFRFLKTRPEFLEYIKQTAHESEPDIVIENKQFDPSAIIIKVISSNQSEQYKVYAVSVLDLVAMDLSLSSENLTDEDTKLFVNHNHLMCDDIIEVKPYGLEHGFRVIYAKGAKVRVGSITYTEGIECRVESGLYLARKQDLVLLETDVSITELKTALDAKDYRKAFYLLSVMDDHKLAETGPNNESVLHCLAKCGHQSLFELALKRMDDDSILEVTYDDELDIDNGCTVLHYIARYGHTKLAHSLAWIKPGSMPELSNTRNNGYCSDKSVPLQDALLAGNYELASILFKYTDTEHTSIILSDAICKKNVRLFELLLGAEPITDHESTISTELVQCGSTLTTINEYGRTNLHIAARYYEPKIFEVVYKAAVEAGLLLCQCTNSGMTFFNELISNGNSEAIIQLTERHDFDTKLLTMLDICGYPPFFWAAGRGLEDVCELLYNIYEDKTRLLTKSRYGSTPLSLAIQGRHVSTVNFIFSKPDLSTLLDIDGADRCYMLHSAIQHSSPDICRILYEKMDTHRVCSQSIDNGHTVLHVAAMYGKTDMIDVLLEDPTKARALLPIIDAKGKTAIEYTDCYPEIHAKLTQARLSFEQ